MGSLQMLKGFVIALVLLLCVVHQQTTLAQGDQPKQLDPRIRYTTGAITVRGWEKSLVDGNPNLGRWNWSAITTYTQTQPRPTSGAKIAQAIRPNSIYVKPIHLPPGIYAPRPVNQEKKPSLAAHKVSTHVNGVLSYKTPEPARLINPAKSVETATYLHYHAPNTIASHDSKMQDLIQESKNVYGKLVKNFP